MPKVAVYPGSFDPITNGHIDIIERASQVFDTVIVAVSNNTQKQHLFSHEERYGLITRQFRGRKNIRPDLFNGLLVDYLRQKKVQVIIRGLRAVSDLDYEFQMAATNRSLYKSIETVFFMPDERYTYLSSSMVREIAANRGKLDPFVPKHVAQTLRRSIAAT